MLVPAEDGLGMSHERCSVTCQVWLKIKQLNKHCLTVLQQPNLLKRFPLTAMLRFAQLCGHNSGEKLLLLTFLRRKTNSQIQSRFLLDFTLWPHEQLCLVTDPRGVGTFSTNVMLYCKRSASVFTLSSFQFLGFC